MGNYDKSIKLYLNYIQLGKKTEKLTKYLEAKAFNEIGLNNVKKEEWQTAFEYFQRAEARIGTDKYNFSDKVSYKYNIARIFYFYLKDNIRAEYKLNELLKMLKNTANPSVSTTMDCQFMLAGVYYHNTTTTRGMPTALPCSRPISPSKSSSRPRRKNKPCKGLRNCPQEKLFLRACLRLPCKCWMCWRWATRPR
jgi:tetratricopeptide (TPR) repeat protein